MPDYSYLRTAQSQSSRLLPVVQSARSLLKSQKAQGGMPRLPKKERAALIADMQSLDVPRLHGGVNFSRISLSAVLEARDTGQRIEFETIGPYLASYTTSQGVMRDDNLIPEDAVGLQLAATFRAFFPQARLVSLCDDYNNGNMIRGDTKKDTVGSFNDEMKHNFRTSLVALLKSCGAIPGNAQDGREFLLLAESQRAADAEQLVARLEALGHIRRNGQEIVFMNHEAENPLYSSFSLRSKNGRWLCEALDAAAFLRPENLTIVHIVVLPEYMKGQQDKVWELLRILHFDPDQYHNIFFDPKASPQQVSTIIREAFLMQ
jgi:hypothetical protein